MSQQQHFIIFIGDGVNFKNSFPKRIWGVDSNKLSPKSFLNKVNVGDLMWFIKNNTNRRIFAVATFTGKNQRVFDSTINRTLTNDELGWAGEGGWDTEIHYRDFYDVSECNIETGIRVINC